MTRLPPRILVLVPVTDIRCAAGHPIDIRPNLYRREWWERCGHNYGKPHGVCGACVHLRPAGAKFVLLTDATTEQMRCLSARDATALEVAEHIASDAAVLRQRCSKGHYRGRS